MGNVDDTSIHVPHMATKMTYVWEIHTISYIWIILLKVCINIDKYQIVYNKIWIMCWNYCNLALVSQLCKDFCWPIKIQCAIICACIHVCNVLEQWFDQWKLSRHRALWLISKYNLSSLFEIHHLYSSLDLLKTGMWNLGCTKCMISMVVWRWPAFSMCSLY